MNLDDLTKEFGAFQALREDLVTEIRELDDATLSAAALKRQFGITPTVVRRLESSGRIHPVRRSRRQNARRRYQVREVLLALAKDGRYATGRIRSRSRCRV